MTEQQIFPDFLAHHCSDVALAQTIAEIAHCCVGIAKDVEQAALHDNLGAMKTTNIQGETQKSLDVIADQAFATMARGCAGIAAWVSEENAEIHRKDATDSNTRSDTEQFMLFFDPLDGSSNIDVNLSVGSIFALYPEQNDVLRSGQQQVAAGYALYGPSLMLVLTFGYGTHGFTYDHQISNFVLTHPQMTIPAQTKEYAINAARRRFWSAAIERYVSDCEAGKQGDRGKDFTLRWAASMVADVHRVLCRGGVFLYPTDASNAAKGGKLRLMYEANPMAMLITQAGGLACTPQTPILQITPQNHHQRVGVVLGSSEEVNRIIALHQTV